MKSVKCMALSCLGTVNVAVLMMFIVSPAEAAVETWDGGYLAPGNSPGILTVDDLVLDAGSIVTMEIWCTDTPGVDTYHSTSDNLSHIEWRPFSHTRATAREWHNSSN